MTAISIHNLVKSYEIGGTKLEVLKSINYEFVEGKLITLMGPSGSGKSSLLHILAGLDRPDSGEVLVFDKNLSKFNETEITIYRRETIGIIFQFFNLLPYLSALENVALPLFLSGKHKKQATELAMSALESVNLSHRVTHKPNELSGGEQQRVAIARAIVNSPRLILADEPTGNLDTENSEKIVLLLKDLQAKQKFTMFMVTHNPEIGDLGDTKIVMRDGNFS